jgi:MYXO-CTERM domain-containing protein
MGSLRAATLLALIAMTSAAAADDYACPQSTNGFSCPHETSVPEGCPVHFLLGHAAAPADVRATVVRGAQTIDATGAATTTTVEHSVGTKDYYSCDCHEISYLRSFDEYALTLIGVSAGETVELSSPSSASVTIGPAAPCPPFVYATNFYEPIACDLCSMPPEATDSGCSVGDASPALLLAIGLVLGLRRRSRRPT